MQENPVSINYQDQFPINKTFSSVDEIISELQSLECNTSRIRKNNEVLMYPAGGNPEMRYCELSAIRDGKIVFDISAWTLLNDLIKGLQTSDEEWKEKNKLSNHVYSNRNQMYAGHLLGKSLDEKIEMIELLKNETCGILTKKENGRGWYLNDDNSVIKEKNKKGHQGYIPTIGTDQERILLINNSEGFKEGDLVVARIENNEIIQLFNPDDYGF